LADEALSGLKNGLTRARFAIQDWDIGGVESITTHRSRTRFKRLRFPQHLTIINYVGIPLSGHVAPEHWDDYITLRKEGPNDCRMTILDGIVPGTLTLPQLGFDHFFWDRELYLKVVALIQVIVKHDYAK
jgi:hypothetical protein